MRKCDICGSEAISELIIKGKDGTSTNDICEKCAILLSDAIVNIANARMREKYGKKTLPMYKKTEPQAESEVRE